MSDYAQMVKEILTKPEYDGKVVLICWEHKAIGDLATAFGVAQPSRLAWRYFRSTVDNQAQGR